MNEPVRIALVGCGGISDAHAKSYGELHKRGSREFEIVACCDVVEAKAKTRATQIAAFQGKTPVTFADVEKLVRAGIAQAADICVPHCFHHSTAIPLLEGGLHVLLEKPLGITIKAGEKIIRAATQSKRILATAEDIRRIPFARAGAWVIRERKLIGEPRTVNVLSLDRNLPDYSNPSFAWRGLKRLTGGGQLLDTGAHLTDMLLLLFGEPDEIFCVTANHEPRVIENAPGVGRATSDIETAWSATIRFTSGVIVTWTATQTYAGAPFYLGRYTGSAGAITSDKSVLKPLSRGFEVARADGSTMTADQALAEYMATLTEEAKGRLFPHGCTNGYGIELWDFINAVAENRRPEVDGHDGQRAKALCLACYESATAGQPVKFAEVLNGGVCEYQKPINEFWKI